MNRIDSIFASLRARQGKALMPYLTAGDPDLEVTGRILQAFDAAGASVCELGFPFSDPIADGPIIQDSMAYALEHGTRPANIFATVRQVRPQLKLGIMAMVSYTIVYRLGVAEFVKQAADAGIDGLIVPDLAIEESATLRKLAGEAHLSCSFLVAPNSTPARAQQVARACTGFVYVLARAGVTGERTELPADLEERLKLLRQVTDLPLAVGFGVSNAAQVRQVVRVGDAAIVGSAIMRRIAQHRREPAEVVVQQVRAFVEELMGGITSKEAGAGS